MYQGLSPAQAYKLRTEAKKETAEAIKNPSMARNTYELMLGKLAVDRRRLKKIRSLETKIAVKREVLPEYKEYLNGVLEADAGAPDLVLTTLMIWYIDVGNFDMGLTLAEYALTYQLAMPAHFDRNLEEALTEEIADNVLKQESEAVNRDHLYRLFELVHGKDMPDQILSKLMKALGNAEHDNDPEKAIQFYERALALNDRAGCRKTMNKLKSTLQNQS